MSTAVTPSRHAGVHPHPLRIALGAAMFACLATPGVARAQAEPDLIRWPASGLTLQQAIDRVADGGRVVIGPGTYQVAGPLVVTRNVFLEGAGCSVAPPRPRLTGIPRSIEVRRPPQQFTRLVGPPPTGDVPHDRAVGLINFVGLEAGGVVTGLELVGFDAGLVIGVDMGGDDPRPDPRHDEGDVDGDGPEGRTESLTVLNTCVTDTGHGLVLRRPGSVTVTGSLFMNCLGNCVAGATPNSGSNPALVMRLSFIQAAVKSCISMNGSSLMLMDVVIEQCGTGGGVGAIQATVVLDNTTIAPVAGPGVTLIDSQATILNSTITGGRRHGLGLFNSVATVTSSIVHNTTSDAGSFGDGVTVVSSVAGAGKLTLVDSAIGNSARAALSNFGSHAMLADNLIAGYAFALNGETFAGVGFSFNDAGDNLCTVVPASLTALQTFVALNDVLDIINMPPSLQTLLPGGLGSLLGSAGPCLAVSSVLEPPVPN